MQGTLRSIRIAATVLLLASSASARAVPIDYTFTLVVDEIFRVSPGTDIQVGNSFTGAFQVSEDTSLLADGIYSFIPLNAWSISIGSVNWDMNAPSDFTGFRDGAFCGAPGSGTGGINPGLIVSGGEVGGFCGGVFGLGDRPFIDFDYRSGPGLFTSSTNFFDIAGRYQVDRLAVIEPAQGLWLTAFGVLGAAFVLRRRPLRRETYTPSAGPSPAV